MKLNRSSFLKLAGAISIPLLTNPKNLLSQAQLPKTQPGTNFSKTALIIGGGLSGLYIAYLLKKSNYRVRIIEASNRLGGRILSYNNPELKVSGDLGGEWIGEGQTQIRNLVRELKLNLQKPNWNQIQSLWDPSRLSEKSRSSLEKLVEFQSRIPANQVEGLDKISLFRYLNYQGFSEGELEDLDKVVKAFYGETSKNISSQFLLASLDSKKSLLQNLFKVEGGSEQITKKLAESLNPEDFILEDPVSKISYSGSGVQVELGSGNMVRSRIAFCTIPAYSVSEIQWTPALPREKIFCLLRIGYGKIRKELVTGTNSGFIPQEGSGVVDWVLPNSQTLQTIIATEGRAHALDRSGVDIRNQLITRSLPGGTDWTPLTTGIERNGFGRGSVSIYSPSTFGIKETLESPVSSVYFAGEHLGEIPGTMEAAVSSALRAINKI